jgi:hypothetical protein
MLELIQFVFTLFTNPLLAIGGVLIIGLIIGGLRWSAYRSSSNVPLDAEPEMILRHLLKFDDEDLKHNRSIVLSPTQIKRIRKEFVILIFAYIAIIVFFGFLFVGLFWEDMSGWGLGYLIGLVIFMVVGILFIIGIAAFQLQGYIDDLKTKTIGALFSPIVFEEHEGEYMTFKFKTHQYHIIASDPRLSEPLRLRIGFMSDEVWYRVQKLENRSAILYVAPGAGKLLSFELAANVPNIKA